jgi:hypothetical protein
VKDAKKTLIFLLLCQTTVVVAQLPSIIKEDFIIRKSMSPLKFNKTYIDKNVTLTIEPGVVLEGNKLEVDGTLILLGKAHDSITIRIKELLTNHKIVAKYCTFDQTGLRLYSLEESGRFNHCIFSNSHL